MSKTKNKKGAMEMEKVIAIAILVILLLVILGIILRLVVAPMLPTGSVGQCIAKGGIFKWDACIKAQGLADTTGTTTTTTSTPTGTSGSAIPGAPGSAGQGQLPAVSPGSQNTIAVTQASGTEAREIVDPANPIRHYKLKAYLAASNVEQYSFTLFDMSDRKIGEITMVRKNTITCFSARPSICIKPTGHSGTGTSAVVNFGLIVPSSNSIQIGSNQQGFLSCGGDNAIYQIAGVYSPNIAEDSFTISAFNRRSSGSSGKVTNMVCKRTGSYDENNCMDAIGFKSLVCSGDGVSVDVTCSDFNSASASLTITCQEK